MDRMWRVFFAFIYLFYNNAVYSTPLQHVIEHGRAEEVTIAIEQMQNTVSNVNDAHAYHNNVIPLGQNIMAWLGAWASMGIVTITGSYLIYKALDQIFDKSISFIPFLRPYHKKTSSIAALSLGTPISCSAFIKCGPLIKYFFYILYAGERISPLLARDALHDVRVYVQHLQTVKSVQKELYEVIEQINQLSREQLRGMDVELLVQLDDLIKQDEAYIQTVVAQLQQFLSHEEIELYLHDIIIKHLHMKGQLKDYCIAPELSNQTQAIIMQLQTTVHSMDEDALVLNDLMHGLIDYWQRYTRSLAEGINEALNFCNKVYIAEQIISKWLDRSLLCA